MGKPLNINLDTLVVTRGYATHHRALEMLAAMARGFMPATADRDGSAVPSFKVIANPWTQTNTLYWWMFDSSMKNSRYGLQLKIAQDPSLEGPNLVFKTGEVQLNLVELKPSLINGESPVVDNAQQPRAKSRGVATTEREGLLKRVSNSLNTAYDSMKAVSWTEMFQPTRKE